MVIIKKRESELLRSSFDFIGINYYSSTYAKAINKPVGPPRYSTDYGAELTAYRGTHPIGPKAEGSEIYVYPKGLQKLLVFMNRTYQHPTIYITENGVTEANVETRPLNVSLNDPHRISYIKQHLYYLLQAIKKGVDVKAYIYWALFDDFEWTSGFQTRYGLFYIDYKNNLTRIPKESAKWFRSFLTGPPTPTDPKVGDGVLYA